MARKSAQGIIILFWLAAIFFAVVNVNQALAAGTALPSSYLEKVGKADYCGYLNSAWKIGSLKSGKFTGAADDLKAQKKALKKAKPSKRAGIQKKIDALKKKVKKQKLCNGLGSPALVDNLSSFPETSNIVAGSGQAGSSLGISAVSGTPPVLPDIPGMNILELFWRPGVVEGIVGGSPTQQQCSEFFNGQVDGDSGGLCSCHMAQGVGHSFQPVLQSGASLCYMKNAPTEANYAAGAVQLVSGEFPAGGVAHLFDVPQGASDRLVKILSRGAPVPQGNRNIFIKVASRDSNDENNRAYKVTLWMCSAAGGGTPREYHNIALSKTNQYSINLAEQETESEFQAAVSGALTYDADGVIIFDPTADREADVVFHMRDDSMAFKGNIRITADGKLKVKNYDAPSVHMERHGYTVSSYSGESLSDLRFLEGAFKDVNFRDGSPMPPNNGATQYRSSYYAAAPASELSSLLDEVDLNSDPFYSTAPSVAFDPTDYSCDATPDIVVQMNMNNPAMMSLAQACELRRLDGMDFCREDSSIQQAQDNYFSVCGGGHP